MKYSPLVFPCTQSTKTLTLAYTPGLLASAHPYPQLVTPACDQGAVRERLHTRGPPESPYKTSMTL